MKILAFSTVYFPDARSARSQFADIADWRERAISAMPECPRLFLVDGEQGANHAPLWCECIQAGAVHSAPYHCRDWSYAAAAYQTGWHYAMQMGFHLCAFLAADAVLGVDLRAVIDEFMARPEVLCGPAWFDKVETHFMLMKPAAVQDALFSLPFTPLPKFPARNAMYYEEALGLLFAGRWWDPWPNVRTIREEYQTPEFIRGHDEEKIKWPMLAKGSPATIQAYRHAHPAPLRG